MRSPASNSGRHTSWPLRELTRTLKASAVSPSMGPLLSRAITLISLSGEPGRVGVAFVTWVQSDMAAGDEQRVWFPEMIDELRDHWREGLSFDALLALRDAMDAMLQQIRAARYIRPPVERCPHCGRVGEGEGLHVTVRAMILAFLRYEIAAPEPVYALEKSWARYRKQNNLDPYGKVIVPASGGPACSHEN
jgi:hypothetical protein